MSDCPAVSPPRPHAVPTTTHHAPKGFTMLSLSTRHDDPRRTVAAQRRAAPPPECHPGSGAARDRDPQRRPGALVRGGAAPRARQAPTPGVPVFACGETGMTRSRMPPPTGSHPHPSSPRTRGPRRFLPPPDRPTEHPPIQPAGPPPPRVREGDRDRSRPTRPPESHGSQLPAPPGRSSTASPDAAAHAACAQRASLRGPAGPAD